MPPTAIGTPKPLHGNTTVSKEHRVNLDPPLAAATGVPAECSVWWDFTSKYGLGAVLACPSGLRKEGYFEGPHWVRWAKENASAIMKYCPQVKDHNLWIVTTIYKTKEAWVNVWGDKENVVSIGFSAGVEGMAKLAPSVKYAESSSGSNWRTVPAHGTSNEDVVVFFHGVEMKYTRLKFGMAGLRAARGAAEVVQDPEDERVEYEVGVQTAGF